MAAELFCDLTDILTGWSRPGNEMILPQLATSTLITAVMHAKSLWQPDLAISVRIIPITCYFAVMFIWTGGVRI